MQCLYMAYALRTSVEVLVTILVFLILIARKNVKEETKTDKRHWTVQVQDPLRQSGRNKNDNRQLDKNEDLRWWAIVSAESTSCRPYR